MSFPSGEDPEPTINTTTRPMLGRYELIAELGRGGMANVFLAVARGRARFDKLVVVKRLREDVADDPLYRTMFLDEARLAVLLNHPNVVTTFEVEQDDESIFLAMEYLDGEPLHAFASEALKSKRPIGPEMAARIAADSLAGLHYAHELSDYDGRPLHIVHRDVSPHNLFVTFDGQVKVVDFGVAKADARETQTEVGIIKGKAAYMAPEQMLGRPIDGRADVFAMGIVLWELLACQRLMARSTAGATIHRVLRDPIHPPSRVKAGVPPELDAIAMRALERDPGARYASADEMRRELEAFLRRHPSSRDDLTARLAELFGAARERRKAAIQDCLTSPPASVEQLHRLEPIPAGPSLFPAQPTPSGHGPGANGEPGVAPQHPSQSSPSRTGPAVTAGTAGPPAPASSQDETLTAVHPAFTSPGPSVMARPRPASFTPSAAAPDPGRAPGRKRELPVAIAGLILLAAALGLGFFMLRLRQPARPMEAAAVGSAAAASAVTIEVLLHVHGSNTIGAHLGPALAEAFLKKEGASNVAQRPYPEDSRVDVVGKVGTEWKAIEIEAKGSGTAFEDLGRGRCDVGMSSRPIKPEEASALHALGDLTMPASEHVVGLDGIAVIVHPNNPLRTIDTARLRALFSGKTPDWSPLGVGGPGAVRVYARDDESGTYDTFRHLVLGGEALAQGAARFDDNERLATAVSGDIAGVGFVGFRQTGTARVLAVGEPGAEPLYPSTFTIATEDYVLSRRLYLYTAAEPKNGFASEFVAFALSTEGQAVVRNAGFVDLTVRMADSTRCDEKCPKKYAEATRDARRISVDFRFRSSSAELDTRAQRDIERVVEFLRSRGTPRVRLLGFSDGAGDTGGAGALSLERATAVKRVLVAYGVQVTVEGLGAAVPIASNVTEAGRQRNRRVEVWVTP